ncbi:MAG: GTPase domain-containing protein [Clostridiales bacterium]|nr:GTPase domain-containing protein [Clostridiales bacterium]
METNILCEKEERVALSNLYEGISVILQDSDDEAEKQKIKKAIQGMNSNTTYIILGEAQSGKTAILRSLFQDVFVAEANMSGDICEYRWGEQEFTSPITNGFQKRFLTSDNIQGLSIIDTKGLNQVSPDALAKIQELTENANAIFVSLDAQRINSMRLWDLIEKFPSKKMIFFLTKCDLLQPEELTKAREKLEQYMKESNISAPIFPISLTENGSIPGAMSLSDARSYVKEQLIGPNPILDKQRENIEKGRQLLIELEKSFASRKKQYISDSEILRKINDSMDVYVANQKQTLEGLIKRLEVEINTEINSYENEIISKIDPYKIKERFKKQEDFMDYLNMVNENYKNRMNDSVNHKTMESMKKCLHELELIFKDAVGYFNTRENILELNDRFYGSLSKSRNEMVTSTREAIVYTGELYRTLSDASEELFLQIWNAREKYDDAIRTRRAGAIGGGSLTVGGGAVGIAIAAGFSGSVIGLVALAGIGAIVGGVLFNTIAKSLFDPKAASKMEETTQKCIEQFKSEVEHTRTIMIEEITSQVTKIFEKELASVDGCFTEFRMSVNIDERKIPLLEQKLQETQKLIQYIDSYNSI